MEVRGSILDLGPNRVYSVRLPGGGLISAHVGGALQMRIVRLIPGDEVIVKLSETDPSRGRIVRRLEPKQERGRGR